MDWILSNIALLYDYSVKIFENKVQNKSNFFFL